MGLEKSWKDFQVNLTGHHNKAVNVCPECGALVDKLFDNMEGFSDSPDGLKAVVECPKCFFRWEFHGRDCFCNFTRSIEKGKNAHYFADYTKRFNRRKVR